MAYLAIEGLLTLAAAVCSRGVIEPPGVKAPSIGIATCKAVSSPQRPFLANPSVTQLTFVYYFDSVFFPCKQTEKNLFDIPS